MSHDYLASTIAAYNQATDVYITSNEKLSFTPEIEAFSSFLKKGDHVLDVGCAGGHIAEALQAQGLKVTGIDVAPIFIEKAQALVPKAEFMLMDIRHLTFETHSFEGIWAKAILLHLTLEDIGFALKEFKRILKPGGVAFICMKKGQGSQLAEGSLGAKNPLHYTFVDMDQLKSLLVLAGFIIEDSYEENEKNRFPGIGRDLVWVSAFVRTP